MTLTDTLRTGGQAPSFNLPGVDGRTYRLEACLEGRRAVAVMFICNHCPYVQAYLERINAIQREYGERGVQLLAINSNDTTDYPEDGFEQMVPWARERGLGVPYLRDETQEVARVYGATHTPHVFLVDDTRQLRYSGRIDDNWQEARRVRSHDLRQAIEALLAGVAVAQPQTDVIGCTIKWRK